MCVSSPSLLQSICFGLDGACLLPSKSYVEGLTSRTSECNFIFKQEYCRWNCISEHEIILKQGGPLIHCDCCPYKKKFKPKHTLKENAMWSEGRDQGDTSTKQGTTKMVSKTPEARGEAGTRLPFTALAGSNPTDTLSWTPHLHNWKTMHFCCLGHFICGTLLQQL